MIICGGSTMIPKGNLRNRARVCSRRAASQRSPRPATGSRRPRARRTLAFYNHLSRTRIAVLAIYCYVFLPSVSVLSARRVFQARTTTSTCRGSTPVEGSLYTCFSSLLTFATILTMIRVNTSHQKVVLEIDFSGRLWVRFPSPTPIPASLTPTFV